MYNLVEYYQTKVRMFYEIFVKSHPEDRFAQNMWTEFLFMIVPKQQIFVEYHNIGCFNVLLDNAELYDDSEQYASILCDIYDLIIERSLT